ncbi:MAG: hypothetical protein N3A72_01735 [bacterium]|nr:hypothetical protein [bacterium]
MKLIIFHTIVMLLLLIVSAQAISRDSVMATAYAYYTATWLCSTANAHSAWNTFTAGMWYTGVPYNMGGWDTLSTCLWKLANGVIAGNSKQLNQHTPQHAGVDCSGLITRCWGIDTGKMYTWTLPSISREIKWTELIRGDILNRTGDDGHVRLFDYFTDGTKQMMVYESTVGVKPARVVHRPVRWNKTYVPRRFELIEELPLPQVPYHDLVYSSDTFYQPWILGGVGKVGVITWNMLDSSTTENSFMVSDKKYIGQLTQQNPGLSYAYTGSSTDSNYTVEVNVWCEYNHNRTSNIQQYPQILVYFNPLTMQYITLYPDFSPGKDRQRLWLRAYGPLGTVKTIKTWQYPKDFPDPKCSGWHQFRLSILHGKFIVWIDGKKLSEPKGKYPGLSSGYVACSLYAKSTSSQRVGWFSELKVEPTVRRETIKIK